MRGAPSWEQDAGMYGIATGTPDRIQRPGCAGIPLQVFRQSGSVGRSELSLVFCNRVSCRADK